MLYKSHQNSADKLTINCLDNTVYFVDHSAMKKEKLIGNGLSLVAHHLHLLYKINCNI